MAGDYGMKQVTTIPELYECMHHYHEEEESMLKDLKHKMKKGYDKMGAEVTTSGNIGGMGGFGFNPMFGGFGGYNGFGGLGAIGLVGLTDLFNRHGFDGRGVDHECLLLLTKALENKQDATYALASKLGCDIDRAHDLICDVKSKVAESEGNIKMHVSDKSCDIKEKICDKTDLLQTHLSMLKDVMNSRFELVNNKIDCSEDKILDRLCNAEKEAIKNSYETRIRDMENTATIIKNDNDNTSKVLCAVNALDNKMDRMEIERLRDRLCHVETQCNNWTNRDLTQKDNQTNNIVNLLGTVLANQTAASASL